MPPNQNPTSAATPKKRQPSCDLCRRRKVKCNKGPLASRCEGCVAIDQDCVYTHDRRKPGPVNKYQRNPSVAQPNSPGDVRSSICTQQLAPDPRNDAVSGVAPSHPPMRGRPLHEFVQIHRQSSTDEASFQQPQAEASPHSSVQGSVLPGGDHASSGPMSIRPPGVHVRSPTVECSRQEGDSAIDWSWLRNSPEASTNPLFAESSSVADLSGLLWHHHTPDEPPVIDLVPCVPDSHHMAKVPAGMSLLPNGDPVHHYNRPSSRPCPPSVSSADAPRGLDEHRGIEEYIPWGTLVRILQAYHTHLYPLLPVMHWPTFLQHLMSREDERSRTWRAYLLSLAAYSIIQLPRSALSFLDVSTLRQLHRACHAGSVGLQNRSYSAVTTTDIACDHIYLSTLGQTTAANVALSKAIRLAQDLKMYDEQNNEVPTDRVELELRRRLFWLLYGSDRTISALTSAPLQISDADLRIPLPSAIDDNLITASGAFPQTPGVPSVLCGFHHVSRIFRLLGSVLTAHRSVTITADSSDLLPPILTPVRPALQFRDALRHILADLPPPLRLTSSTDDSTSVFHDTDRDRQSQHMNSTFETCKANLLVSQAMVRFAIRQYAAAVEEREDDLEDKAWVEKHVLGMLKPMLSDSLAANGESLRNKVLYIASSLIDKYHDFGEGDTYVSGLLSMYASIREQQQANLLESMESAVPSRVPTPGRL
ncbi:hypothetical protein IAU59_004049 [Kwoniella sp. CBS 9459]